MSWSWEAREKIGETLYSLRFVPFHDYRLRALKRKARLPAASSSPFTHLYRVFDKSRISPARPEFRLPRNMTRIRCASSQLIASIPANFSFQRPFASQSNYVDVFDFAFENRAPRSRVRREIIGSSAENRPTNRSTT